jgi:hypothetical protein
MGEVMRRSILLLTVALVGCAGFDDYYLEDQFVVVPAAGHWGCGVAAPMPHTPPPPLANSSFSPSAPPQSREPELLR